MLIYIQEGTEEELAALQKESEIPLEELLKTLPQEVLDGPASLEPPAESQEIEDIKEVCS